MRIFSSSTSAVTVLTLWTNALDGSKYSTSGFDLPEIGVQTADASFLMPPLDQWGPSNTKRSLGKQSLPKEGCPTVWHDITKSLKRTFHGCSRQASTAIRFAFHDAGGYSNTSSIYGPASGGADGSLLLSTDESDRADNNPMQGFRSWMLNAYEPYKDQVGAADFIQVASSIAVRECGAPTVKTVVGRVDDTTPAPEHHLPPAFGEGADHKSLIDLFAAKGIEPRELAALMGAHTVSRSFAELQRGGIPWGKAQDSSPRNWDNRYFSEFQDDQPPQGVARFESDINLADPGTVCGQAFVKFAADSDAWAIAFQDAMYKLSVLGIAAGKVDSLIDCTEILG